MMKTCFLTALYKLKFTRLLDWFKNGLFMSKCFDCAYSSHLQCFIVFLSPTCVIFWGYKKGDNEALNMTAVGTVKMSASEELAFRPRSSSLDNFNLFNIDHESIHDLTAL